MDRDKRILGLVRKAVQDYTMISSGDKLAVGLSGGKDSMALLWALSRMRAFFPLKYELCAITVDLGYGEPDADGLKRYCDSLNTELIIVKTRIGEVVTQVKTGERPCSICANMRRGALNNAAVAAGAGSVALAHNKDDVIETLLMSLFNEGRINTFSPVTYLERSNIRVIRPLIYADERDIKAWIVKSKLTPLKNPCPYNGHTDRQRMKELLDTLEADRKDIRNTVFGAVKRSDICGW